MRDMEKKRAYDRAYIARMRHEINATGGDICVQCWRKPREIGAVCSKCHKCRRRWTRRRYLKVRPNAGRQHCRRCGEQNHNARTCPTRDMSYQPLDIREIAVRRLEG